MSSDDVEALFRALDTFEWLSKTSDKYASRVAVELFQSSVLRLRETGFSVEDFLIPPGAVYGDGTMDRHSFTALAGTVLGWAQRELKRQGHSGSTSDVEHAVEETVAVPNSVFIVHGQDQNAFDTIIALLREVELLPREFMDARRLTKSPMPYIGQVLDVAFRHAQAVVLLFTPDERVELQDRLRGSRPIEIGFQPRPNVLIEAGIALSTHPDRTVIVEMGNVRAISDLSGRHVVRWREDTPAERSELLDRLVESGCHPNRQGTRWMDVARVDKPTWK